MFASGILAAKALCIWRYEIGQLHLGSHLTDLRRPPRSLRGFGVLGLRVLTKATYEAGMRVTASSEIPPLRNNLSQR